jgi:hydrogenase expression/formation protein HypD
MVKGKCEIMAIKHAEEYRDPELAEMLIKKIRQTSQKPVRLMEVCGTHTMAIFRHGIRQVISEHISLLSGPGCPVCVTTRKEIDTFIALSGLENTIVATFGDLMRVPGTESSLQNERACGKDIRMVYSTFDALDLARKNPNKKIIFLGVGFETTAPTIAASIISAFSESIRNYFVYSSHKRVIPALFALMEDEDVNVDGLILPGHVSVIIGMNAYRPLFDKYHLPCTVTGFEPVDILKGISSLIDQIELGNPRLDNTYPRAVTAEGNKKAKALMEQVFENTDTAWRGLGTIPRSGLKIREAFEAFDAQKAFTVRIPDSDEPTGCVCGNVLKGVVTPPECGLFNKICTPSAPVGPCMVSSEGTCSAYYRFHSKSL